MASREPRELEREAPTTVFVEHVDQPLDRKDRIGHADDDPARASGVEESPVAEKDEGNAPLEDLERALPEREADVDQTH